MLKVFYSILFVLGYCLAAEAQIKIKGTVYDKVYMQPLTAVSVVSTLGTGTITDSMGHYTLFVRETDSISFSYLNKSTPKYAVAAILNKEVFDIALHVPVTDLTEVKIVPRNYKTDSLQNRLDYAKAFDFQKPGISLSAPSNGFGVGIDLNELIGMFQFRKNRRMLAFQQRLIREEQDKYVDHRFTRSLVRKITNLINQDLDDFMIRFRPSYEFTVASTDYELAEYIKLTWQYYLKER